MIPGLHTLCYFEPCRGRIPDLPRRECHNTFMDDDPTGTHPPGNRPENRGDDEITRLLRRWGAGDRQAATEILPLLYGELRRIAARYAQQERAGHTLQATAIVHEAYLRLISLRSIEWSDRRHFLGTAASVMRRVLVDHARERNRAKRGGGQRPVTLAEAAELTRGKPPDLVALDEALQPLEQVDPQLVAVVELRFFAGLSIEETAAYLDASRATVVRRWRRARAWLYDELCADDD